MVRRKPSRLIADPPPGLRERPRADGSTRVWWEPTAEARAKGMKAVELSAEKLTWSVREARRLNREAAAAAGPRRRVAGVTVGHVIDDYLKTSLRFQRARPATQGGYRQRFAMIRAKWGDELVADFAKPVVATWYETLYRTRGKWMAVALIRHLSILFSHAELRGWRPENSNPATRIGMQIPKGRRRAADWAQFDALLAAADRLGLPSVGHAVALSTLQGQRQTDVLEARRELFAEIALPVPGAAEPARMWVWKLTRSKRGNASVLPLHPEALARLSARLAEAAPGPLLADERTGLPYTRERFHNRFAEVREAAIKAGCPALAGLQFRDLRRTFSRMSRAGGAGRDDVADVLGNSAATDQYLADVYMAPEILSLARAVAAVQRPQGDDERKKA